MEKMIRYLTLLVFVSCNSNQETASPIAAKTDSSIQLMIDSISLNVDSIGDMTETVQGKVARLERENAMMARDLGEKRPPLYYQQSKDVLISSKEPDYSTRIEELERENARLRKRIATDSTYIARMNKVAPITYEPEKPNQTSLIVQPVPSNNIDIYLIPYSRKAKKKLMIYEAACDLSLINKLGGKLAGNYKGQHFFNDVPPGRYIVKFCTYFGNFQEIEKTNEKQFITLQTSPPLK